MAEFALGLTKTAVEGTVSLVKSAVEEEKKLRETVQNDLVFIGGEFEMMRSFLRITKERAANDEVTLTLVRQLRTLAFDVEDCVENVVHLELDKSSILGGLQRLWQKVIAEITLNCRAPPLPLDEAIAEIKQLKARVEDVSQRNKRYNLILHGSNNNSTNNKQLSAEEPPYATTTYTSSTAFRVLRDAWKATDKWSSNMCNLQQELLVTREGEGDHDLRVISVWGNSSTGRVGPGAGAGAGAGAGHGMGTNILTNAYYDPQVCENFKIRVWVKLTNPFNHDEFVKSLLAQFYVSSSHQAKNAGVDFCAWMKAEVIEADNLMKAKNLMQQMSEQRYLVVLEDVLTMAEWDVIRMYLPNSNNGSRILLSTPQLGIALLCTGEPYQVSELRNFSDGNRFRCAFYKKEKTLMEIGEFVRQLLRGHGVISVWGADDDDKSNIVDILYKGIINGWLEEIGEVVADKSDHVDMLYEGIRNRRGKFERWYSSWVDVPDPFDLKVFAQRLFLNFYSDDIRASEIKEVGMLGEAGLIEWCRMFLSEEEDYDPYVVVIYGLQSKGDWDLIQSKFFSPKTATGKGCILVITNEETVATHCVKDRTHLVFNAKDLKTDPSISALINKGCWQYAIRGQKGRLFYDRKKDAREWANKFEHVGGNILDPNAGKDEEEGFHVFMVKRDQKDFFTVKLPWSTKSVTCVKEGGNSERGVLRHAYYGALFQQQIERRCSWVDLPCSVDCPWAFMPLELMDFAWRLLLDFYSDDPQAKEQVAVGPMEGTIIDPIEKCREILRNNKCLVVINGLNFYNGLQFQKKNWFKINDTFFSEQHIQSIIILGFSELCDGTVTKALWLDTQQEGRLIDQEYRRIFSTRKRYQKAIRWFETQQPIGCDREVEDLLRDKVLTENLVAVWGISGIGKSTVARTAYYKEIIYSSGLESSYGLGPTEAFAWVDVPSPFNLTDFAWRLLLDFYSDDPHAKECAAVSMVEQGRQVPILECRKILRTGKYLVVMDGLRSKQDWDLIKDTFLAGPLEGTIIVITNEEEVAMHCVGNDKSRTVNITRLNTNAARSLFEKIAFKGKESTCQHKVLPKSIVDKCGGLPKVIAAIGEAWTPESWLLEQLSNNFIDTLEKDPQFYGLRPLFSWMQSYFDACPDSIKPCIFYLSIFDAEKHIRLRRLLWRWIAEGYCRDTSDGATCEENGGKFVSELVKLSIIQESASSKVQINGFFHEYIISRPMEDNLVFALEERCSLNSQRAGQHLIIRSSWDRNEIVYESIDFSRLRSLTVFGKWESFFICGKKVNMRLLRVLDLEDATDVTNEDLDKIAKLLTRLKFLSLRGHTKITCLPISMGGLRQLQILDIRGTFIVTLPLFITKLKMLRYIRAGTSEVWDWEGDIVAADGEEDRASTRADEEGDIVSADGGDEDRASSSAQAVTNLPPPAATTEGGTDSTGLVLPAEPGSLVSCHNRPRTLVCSSFLSKLCRRACGGLDNNGPATGVMVPADIGKLAVLHTLGVVKISAQWGKAIFQELKKLTQLRKLSVSSINKENIKAFCEAISHLAHLKSLSMELDEDVDLDDNIPEPPKTIQSLKLYGRVHKLLLVWMKHFDELEKLHLTIEKPEEFRDLPELSKKPHIGLLRIRPIQDGELTIGLHWTRVHVVEIQCSSILHIKFDDQSNVFWNVDLLKVHFSGVSQSSLQISGLSVLCCLAEVWLKGYTESHKQDMQRQIDGIELDQDRKRPVLKLVRPRSS